MAETHYKVIKQASNESLESLLKDQIEGSKKVDKKKEFPTIRTDVVVGIHRLRSANDILQALIHAVPSMAPALKGVASQVAGAIDSYSTDVENLEDELLVASDAEDSLGAKLIEAEARFKLKCDEVEHLDDLVQQKNVGFVETLQARNRESAALEAKLEGLERDRCNLVHGNNEAERYIKLLLNHITRDGAKHLPAKLRRFG